METYKPLGRDEMRALFGDLPPRIGVALSGGGLRASLHGFGVLAALVDLGLNKSTDHIASVSGGSMTNAFVALRCDFAKEKPDDFDKVVKEFTRLVVKRGLVALWPTVVILVTIVGGLSIAAGLLTYLLLQAFASTTRGAFGGGIAIGIVTALALLLCRGHLFEWQLYRGMFRAPTRRGRARFSDLTSGATQHTFCATEVPTGQPFYFTTRDGGQFRFQPEAIKQDYNGSSVYRCCRDLSVAAAVRSSGALPPVVPPRLLKLRHFTKSCSACAPLTAPSKKDPPYVFLSDGGVWNNLATQAFEDELFSTNLDCLIVANASALLKRERPWYLFVPFLAELGALMRNADIQNFNTVAPRRRATRRIAKMEAAGGYKAPLFEWILDSTKAPFDTICDLELHDLFDEQSTKDPCDALGGFYMQLDSQVCSSHELSSDLPLRTTTIRVSAETAKRLILRGYSNTHLFALAHGLTDVRRSALTADRLANFVS